MVKPRSKFKDYYSNWSGVLIFQIFMVIHSPNVQKGKKKMHKHVNIFFFSLKFNVILLLWTMYKYVLSMTRHFNIWSGAWLEPTKCPVHPVKAQISLHIHAVWSVFHCSMGCQGLIFSMQTATTLCAGWSATSKANIIFWFIYYAPGTCLEMIQKNR